MMTTHHMIDSTHGACSECEAPQRARNHYFTGKMLVERDFRDEQRYHQGKIRRHQQRLHGWGTVCGLRVRQHPQEACRDRWVVLEPGTAVDGCGREILVECEELFDFRTVFLERWRTARIEAGEPPAEDEEPEGEHTFQVCVRYRECPAEPVPALFDECGCSGGDDCEPNRILEGFELDLVLDPELPDDDEDEPEDCCELFGRVLDPCPDGSEGRCVVLATVEGYTFGDRVVDPPADEGDEPADGEAVLDNRRGRRLLVSTQLLAEVVSCLCEHGGPPPDEPEPPDDDVVLTRICATNWRHRGSHDSPSLFLGGLGLPDDVSEGFQREGLAVAFDGDVRAGDLDTLSFRTLGAVIQGPSYVWRQLLGVVLAARLELEERDDGTCEILSIVDVVTDDDAPANGALFLLPASQNLQVRFSGLNRVEIQGDFIRDVQGRALDADHLPDWLPARPTGDGVPGGLFESYFSFEQPGRPSINLVGADDLAAFEGVSRPLARRIVARREERGFFVNFEELLDVRGVGPDMLERLRNGLRVDTPLELSNRLRDLIGRS